MSHMRRCTDRESDHLVSASSCAAADSFRCCRLEVPARYINEECLALVPAANPTRQIYCGMVRAADESVKNVTETYEKLGILDDTLIIVSTDNGGTPAEGGNK